MTAPTDRATWEHKRELLYDHPFAPADRTDEMLQTFGLDGWELVSVSRGVAYFKRPLPLGWTPQ